MSTYRLIKQLAVGGMAEVFFGKLVGAEGFERPVAIKRILPSHGREEGFIELFLREARLSMMLQHANIVQVLDLGSLSGQYYMVMEFVDGENLRTLLKAALAHGRALSLREACFITQQVAEGLAYAHSRTDRAGAPLNIVHRDINPSNVMIASTGEVKLTDFGIAKAADGHKETQSGILKGKINYLSPEQVLGHPLDQRSDIFLLGLLLYEMLSGRQLFDGSSLQIVQRLASFDVRTLSPLPGVPGPLWAILQRSLAASPQARFRTAREFSEALQTFLFDHRLRVGTSDIASLFARALPDRRSPLMDLAGNAHEEIHLGEGPAVHAPSLQTSMAALASIRAAPRSPPPRSPPVLRPVSTPLPASVRPTVLSPAVACSPGPQPGQSSATARREAPSSPPRAGTPRRARVSQRIGDILVARGAVSREALERALTLQRRTGHKLGQVLIDHGLAKPDQIVRALSEQSGLPCITDEELQTMPIPEEQIRRVSEALCEKLCAVPLWLRGRELYCAVREPRDLEVLNALRFAASVISVQGVYASEPAIRRAIRRFYQGHESWVPLAREGAAASPAHAHVLQFAEQFLGQPLLEEAATPSRERLLGEEGPLAQLLSLHMRLLDGAMALLGGSAVMGPYLVRLARRTAARMGATSGEETLAGAAASVIALAARLQEPRRFILPEPLLVRALVGSEFPEIAAILSSVLPERGEARTPAGLAEGATLCVVAFAHEVQCVHPGPVQAARALQALRQNPRLPLAALEALAAELAANAPGAGTTPQVLVAEGEAASAMTLQICLMAEGLCMRRARTRAEVQQFVAAGVRAVVLDSQLPDGESLSLVRALRKAPTTARLPIFLLAAKDDSARVAAGLAAGADDVLMRPLNVEVLMAKLRRSLAQQQSLYQMSAS